MEIIFKSINVVNYETNEVSKRVAPESFNDYINELISHINTNASIRDYYTKSRETEVIQSIRKVCEECNEEVFNDRSDIIANRLLRVEIEAQEKVSRLNVNIKRGSLIQVLLRDENTRNYRYLLAKVEHSNFVDDVDFSFKTGFSKDKKTIWKSSMFNLDDLTSERFYARVYTDTSAKFWSNDFLELEPVSTDELNTKKTFDYVEKNLVRYVKHASKRDYLILRNSVILYFRNHEHFDYYEMIDDILVNYEPTEISGEAYEVFIDKIRNVPEKFNFDTQFSPDLSSIKARVRKVWTINDSIELVIKDAVDNLNGTVFIDESPTSNDRYIKIKLDDDDTYRFFKR